MARNSLRQVRLSQQEKEKLNRLAGVIGKDYSKVIRHCIDFTYSCKVLGDCPKGLQEKYFIDLFNIDKSKLFKLINKAKRKE